MPMQFSKRAGLQSHKTCGDRLRDWEIGRVDLVESTSITRHWLGLMLEGSVDIRGIARQGSAPTSYVGTITDL